MRCSKAFAPIACSPSQRRGQASPACLPSVCSTSLCRIPEASCPVGHSDLASLTCGRKPLPRSLAGCRFSCFPSPTTHSSCWLPQKAVHAFPADETADCRLSFERLLWLNDIPPFPSGVFFSSRFSGFPHAAAALQQVASLAAVALF